MAKQNICPILNMHRTNQNAQCVKENCAWWDEKGKWCTIKSISGWLEDIEISIERGNYGHNR